MNPTRPLILLIALASAACVPPAPGSLAPSRAPLSAGLDSVFADTAFEHAHWGVEVRSLRTGERLYARNPERTFVPASNMKLVTAFAALTALGPEHRYRSSVDATGEIRGGTLEGDLVVRGSGDPTLSARFGGDPSAVFRAWADSLRARGVQRISGRLVGSDDVFDDLPLGSGWSWDDLDAAYAAEVGGLLFNEGIIQLRVEPGAHPGEVARITTFPATGYATLTHAVTTTAPGTPARIEISRAAAGPGIVVSGSVPAGAEPITRSVAIRDNTRYFLTVLRETLEASGIEVAGGIEDTDDLAGGAAALMTRTLFTHQSPPLSEILPAFLKPSQNQLGEVLLKTVGRQERGEGSARAGASAADSLLRVHGIPAERLRIADGSGLSRYNLLTPALLTELLRVMHRSPHRDVWHAALPVAGVDGTLGGRLRGTVLEGELRAKTGTLTGVRALSGYIEGADGEPMVFSILLNHHLRSAAAADRVFDAALLRIAR